MSAPANIKSAIGILDDKKTTVVELIISSAIVVLNFLMPTLVLLVFGTGSLWARGKRWKDIGFTIPENFINIAAAGIAAGVAWAVINWFVFLPIINGLTGASLNLSTFEGIEGNLASLLLWLAVTWTLAAFGEELVYRGYLLNRTADLMRHDMARWGVGLLLSSALFGCAHFYQGASGVAMNALFGAYLGLVYLACKRNLWAAVLAHGIADTIGFAMLFLFL
jgi:membrane protease YdiL (CAAX protease family)